MNGAIKTEIKDYVVYDGTDYTISKINEMTGNESDRIDGAFEELWVNDDSEHGFIIRSGDTVVKEDNGRCSPIHSTGCDRGY